MMKQILFAWLATGLMSTAAFAAPQPTTASLARTPAANAKTVGVKVLRVQNPVTYAGIQLGDVLQRTVQLAVAAENTLDTQQLPLKGVQRNGIELRQLQLRSEHQSGQIIYTLVFAYQVFASAGKPQQLQLPAEHLAFKNGAIIELPAWRFWLMAQLPDRLQPAKPTVIAQYRPALLDTGMTHHALIFSLLLACLSGLVLLIRNADWHWLPIMNGPFARAYRQIKHLPATANGQQQAALLLMQAFNTRFGQHMLASQVASFVAQQPVFQSLESQIHRLFNEINAVLYGNSKPDVTNFLQQCKKLTRQLRDCERRV